MEQLFPIRGQIVSAYWTCPRCTDLQRAYRVNAKQGLHRCHCCGTIVRLGLNVAIIPRGRLARTLLPPDYTLSKADRLAATVKARPRTRRVQLLQALGLDPTPGQLISARPGDPMNSITVIQDQPNSG